MPDNTPPPTNEDNDEPRPSWSFMPILALYFVCAALVPWLGKIAAVLVVLLFGFTLWSALSKTEYEKTHKSYPSYPRGDYVINSLMFHIIIPWAIILILAALAYFFRS